MRAKRLVPVALVVLLAAAAWGVWRGRGDANAPIVVRVTPDPGSPPPAATPVVPGDEPLADVWFEFASPVPVTVREIPVANPGGSPASMLAADLDLERAYEARLSAFADAWDAEHADREIVQRWLETELRSWVPFGLVTPRSARISLHARVRTTAR